MIGMSGCRDNISAVICIEIRRFRVGCYLGAEVKNRRSLSSVRVISTRINFEITELSAAKWTTREHALDSKTDHIFRTTITNFTDEDAKYWTFSFTDLPALTPDVRALQFGDTAASVRTTFAEEMQTIQGCEELIR